MIEILVLRRVPPDNEVHKLPAAAIQELSVVPFVRHRYERPSSATRPVGDESSALETQLEIAGNDLLAELPVLIQAVHALVHEHQRSSRHMEIKIGGHHDIRSTGSSWEWPSASSCASPCASSPAHCRARNFSTTSSPSGVCAAAEPSKRLIAASIVSALVAGGCTVDTPTFGRSCRCRRRAPRGAPGNIATVALFRPPAGALVAAWSVGARGRHPEELAEIRLERGSPPGRGSYKPMAGHIPAGGSRRCRHEHPSRMEYRLTGLSLRCARADRSDVCVASSVTPADADHLTRDHHRASRYPPAAATEAQCNPNAPAPAAAAMLEAYPIVALPVSRAIARRAKEHSGRTDALTAPSHGRQHLRAHRCFPRMQERGGRGSRAGGRQVLVRNEHLLVIDREPGCVWERERAACFAGTPGSAAAVRSVVGRVGRLEGRCGDIVERRRRRRSIWVRRVARCRFAAGGTRGCCGQQLSRSGGARRRCGRSAGRSRRGRWLRWPRSVRTPAPGHFASRAG